MHHRHTGRRQDGTLNEGKPTFERVDRRAGFSGRRGAASCCKRWTWDPNIGSRLPSLRRACPQTRARQGEQFESAGGSACVDGRGPTPRARQHQADGGGWNCWSSLRDAAEQLRKPAPARCCWAIDARSPGCFAVSDPIKATTPEALAALRTAGIRVVMATGDGWTTAREVARRLGIDDVVGEVNPRTRWPGSTLAVEGRRVAMAGDGSTTRPRCQGDVGIAMAPATDVAMSSAHVRWSRETCVRSHCARTISLQTVRNMRQNLGFASSTTALGVPIAAGLLYPLTGLLLSR